MSAGNTFENDVMKLVFNATPIANIADNAASAPLTNLFISLHSADPGEAGDQTSNEIVYTGYARVAVLRSSSGWTVTANQAVPVTAISFPPCTGGSATATFFAVGTLVSGAGKLLISGTLSPSMSISSGTTPQLTTATTVTLD